MNGTTVLTESKKQANSWYNINVLISETPDDDDDDDGDYDDNNDNDDLKKTAQTTAMYKGPLPLQQAPPQGSTFNSKALQFNTTMFSVAKQNDVTLGP